MTKQAQQPKVDQSGNKPVQVFRLRGVKVAVFENKTEHGVWHKVSVQRVYREGQEWKTTTSFGRDDLAVLGLLTQRAWEWILETEAAANRQESDTNGN